MTTRRPVAALVVLALFAAACGDDGGDASPGTTDGGSAAYGVQVASYDLATGSPQRFLVGLLGGDNALIVGGDVELEFRYFGADAAETEQLGDGEVRESGVVATFTPVADGTPPPEGEGPREREE